MELVEKLDGLESPSQFYGRSGELAQLEDYFSGNDSVFVVRGNPGIGKTTLTREAVRGRDSYHLEVEMERSDALFPTRVFADVVMDLLGNPEDYDGFREGLNDWYGNEDGADEKDLLASVVWAYHPFEGYESVHTPEVQESRFGDALVHFFNGYTGDRQNIIQVSNYERRWLGEDPKTDDLFRRINEEVSGPNTKIVIESRDHINFGAKEAVLEGIDEFPIDSNYPVDRILGQTQSHPYALELLFSNYDHMKDIDDKSSLEDFLDVAVDKLNEGQLELLQFVAHAQRPVNSGQIIDSSSIFTYGSDVVESMQTLIDRNLVVRDNEGFVVRNPRLGEYVVSDKTEGDVSNRIHTYHGGLSDLPAVQFYHGVAAGNSSLAYTSALRLLDRGTVEEDLAIVRGARNVIDKVLAHQASDEIVQMGLDLGHKMYQRQLRLGYWDHRESMGDIRLRRQRIKNDVPMNEWREMSWGYISSMAESRWDDAAQYLERLVAVGDQDKDMVPAANHLSTILLQERARFDNTLSNDDRIGFLREVVDRMGKQLDSGNSLEDTDRNHFAFSGSLLALYGVNEKLIVLDRSQREIAMAVSGTPNSWQLAEFLGTQAQVQLAGGNLDEVESILERADAMFKKYGDNRRVRCDDIVTTMCLRKLRNSDADFSGPLNRMLKGASPAYFFDYPAFAERQLALVS